MTDTNKRRTLQSMHIELDITFRLATKADLPRLEWYGQYTHFRQLFQSTFHDQKTGKRLMLLADLNGYPIGQIFILLGTTHKRFLITQRKGRGYLYALRVMEHLQGMGIGTRLIHHAERLLIYHKNNWASISVAKTNAGARRLYERLGYEIYGEDEGRWTYINNKGELVQMHEPCWMLKKKIM